MFCGKPLNIKKKSKSTSLQLLYERASIGGADQYPNSKCSIPPIDVPFKHFLLKGGRSMHHVENPPAGKHYIFVRCYRNKKTGQMMYASAYGLKAFRFLVDD